MKYFSLLWLSVAMVLAGCSAGASGTLQPEKDNYEAKVEYHSVQIRGKLTIVDMRQRKVGDLLQVSVDLTNERQQSLAFQYQFKFYDKEGFEVGTEGRPWTPLVIVGKDTQTVQATAPNPSAVQFKIAVRD